MKLILTSDLRQGIPKWMDLVDRVRRELEEVVSGDGDSGLAEKTWLVRFSTYLSAKQAA
jgi:hypothetical protein